MPKTLNEMVAELPVTAQKAIDVRANELVRQTSLRELRKALGITQSQLAEVLQISQAAISKQEHRKEIQVSTLHEIIEAMGGELEIIARFPGDRVVRL